MFSRAAVQRAVLQASRRNFAHHAPAVEKPVLGMEKPAFPMTKRVTNPGDFVRAPPTRPYSFNRAVPDFELEAWVTEPVQSTVISAPMRNYNPIIANVTLGLLLGAVTARCCYVGGEYATRCAYARAGDERQAQIKEWYEARLLQGPIVSKPTQAL